MVGDEMATGAHSGMTDVNQPAVVPPRRRRFISRGVLLGILAAAALAGGVLYARPWAVRPIAVSVEIVAPGPLKRVLAINGRIAARRLVAVRSPLAGTLAAVGPGEGDTVAEGQELARLDDAVPRAQVAQAEAALVTAGLQSTRAQADVDRARALGANAPKKTLEDALSALAIARSDESRVAAMLEQARQTLGHYRLVAPLSGTVITRDAEPGQTVDTQATLFAVADLADTRVEADIDEIHAGAVRPGMPALMRPAGQDGALAGQVESLAATVDAATGGRMARLAFAVPVSLPPGLSVTVNITVAETDTGISVPRSAIVAPGGVLVVTGGVATFRAVTVMAWPAERLEVTSGLAAGDRVIIDPSGIAPGDPVTEVRGG